VPHWVLNSISVRSYKSILMYWWGCSSCRFWGIVCDDSGEV